MVNDDNDHVISCSCGPRSNGRWVPFRSLKTLVPILRIELSSERKGEGRECVIRLFGRGRCFAAIPGEGEIRWNLRDEDSFMFCWSSKYREAQIERESLKEMPHFCPYTRGCKILYTNHPTTK